MTLAHRAKTIRRNMNKRRAAKAGLTNALTKGLHCMDLDLLNSLQILEAELFNETAIPGLVRLPEDHYEQLVWLPQATPSPNKADIEITGLHRRRRPHAHSAERGCHELDSTNT